MNIELNNLIEWTTGVERWMNNWIEWIFEIRYWIEYWIESFLGPIQCLNESSKSIEHPYLEVLADLQIWCWVFLTVLFNFTTFRDTRWCYCEAGRCIRGKRRECHAGGFGGDEECKNLAKCRGERAPDGCDCVGRWKSPFLAKK